MVTAQPAPALAWEGVYQGEQTDPLDPCIVRGIDFARLFGNGKSNQTGWDNDFALKEM
jgi:hypothetical protein